MCQRAAVLFLRVCGDVLVVFRRWLALKFPSPCGALWQFVAVVNPCVASKQAPGVAVQPFTNFYKEIYIYIYIYIYMVSEASRRCCESIIDG